LNSYVDRTRIPRHINNIYNDHELERKSTSAESAHMGSLGTQKYSIELFNLDMIISVGYRVKSQRGIIFRRWANKVLKDQELDNSVVEESSVTASDGKNYLTKLYILDMIISVGYRVKSQRGNSKICLKPKTS
jgi:hypothetical protein